VKQNTHKHSGQDRKGGGVTEEAKRERPSFKNLGREIQYLRNYRGITVATYVALFLSTGAQLLVPQFVQEILDAVTRGMLALQLASMPPQPQNAALRQIGMTD